MYQLSFPKSLLHNGLQNCSAIRGLVSHVSQPRKCPQSSLQDQQKCKAWYVVTYDRKRLQGIPNMHRTLSLTCFFLNEAYVPPLIVMLVHKGIVCSLLKAPSWYLFGQPCIYHRGRNLLPKPSYWDFHSRRDNTRHWNGPYVSRLLVSPVSKVINYGSPKKNHRTANTMDQNIRQSSLNPTVD